MKRSADESYIMTKTLFRNFVQTAGYSFNKKSIMVEFILQLPFELACIDRHCSVHTAEGTDDVIFFLFTDTNTNVTVSNGASNLGIDAKRTKVEMIYVVNEKRNDYLDADMLSAIFEALLFRLNREIRNYMINTKDYNVYYLSIGILEPIVLTRQIKINRWKIQTGLHLVNFNYPTDKEKIENPFGFIPENGFSLSEELMLHAVSYSKTGRNREAVMFTQCSIETMINALLYHFLKCEGHDDRTISEKIEELSFIKRVTAQMPQRIGGTWDVTLSGQSVGRWYTDTYELRNRVTHSGFLPTSVEVDQCIRSACEFRIYIIECILKKKNKYPDLEKEFAQLRMIKIR